MKRALRILAVFVLLVAVIFWAAKGANRGWTINNLEQDSPDPVTGITGVSYEKVFIPGWDFLAVAVLAAAALTGASFLFGNKKAGTGAPVRSS